MTATHTGKVNRDQSGGAVKLTGRPLIITRVVWAALSLLVAGLYIWAISSWNLKGQDIPYLVLIPLAYFLAGLVIFWRKSDVLMGLLTSLMLIFMSPYMTSGVNVWISEKSGWETFGGVMAGIGGMVIIFFIYLFPNGRFVPAWMRWYAIVASIVGMITLGILVTIWPNLPAIVFLPLATVGLISQVYRYWRISNAVQRQQTKWVLIGVSVQLIGILWWISLGFPAATQLPTIQLLGFAISVTYIYALISLVFPLTIAFSILRYRLWDIDLLIRRTLVYAALTALLLIVYFSSVVLLQQVLRALTGQDSQVVIVISTLAIAALFSPLRRRVQDTIDRRFYRRKYDAQKALASFAATARDEVDMDTLTTTLLEVVEETIQPERASLWLTGEEK
jgi:hypothetical protein